MTIPIVARTLFSKMMLRRVPCYYDNTRSKFLLLFLSLSLFLGEKFRMEKRTEEEDGCGLKKKSSFFHMTRARKLGYDSLYRSISLLPSPPPSSSFKHCTYSAVLIYENALLVSQNSGVLFSLSIGNTVVCVSAPAERPRLPTTTTTSTSTAPATTTTASS